MAKDFERIAFDPKRCRVQIDEFAALLRSKGELSERQDIQPFFRARDQLSAFVGAYIRSLGPTTDFAYEYPIYGDFAADLVVGDRTCQRYCVVEFKDGRNDSIFRNAGRSITVWSRRFDRGFSQIVDWFSLLDDLKKTERFKRDFGAGHVRFSALLVIGRDSGVSAYDRYRLDWRTEKVRIDSHNVECVTFDSLHEQMDRQLKLNTGY